MKKFFLGLAFGIAIAGVIGLLLAFPSYGDKIAVLRIKGTITSSPSFLEESVSPESLYPAIEKIEKDPTIKGVLIEINSPGGSAVASRELSIAVKSIKKPKVCWMGDVAASGAYWIASACDRIVADPLTLTGSIGVTASYLQFAGTLDKYGVTYERFVTGPYKDTGSPFRNLTEEERHGMFMLVNETFQVFLEDLQKNRKFTAEELEMLKSGGMFLGKDAVKIGLVDDLGSWYDAKEMIKNQTGTVDPEFIEFRKPGMSFLELLGSFM